MDARGAANRAVRVAVIVMGSLAFLLVVPAVLVGAALLTDRLLELPSFFRPVLTVPLGLPPALWGVVYMARSVLVQYTIGEGTPMPLMPPRKLVVSGPYRQCRNPMALGNALYFLGVAVIAGSVSALVYAAAGSALILLYNRVFEERELFARFGDDYRRYRDTVPFVIPRFRK